MEKYDTLKYYNDNANVYCEQTKYGDMQEAYDRFLVLLPKEAYILDFGCGSGRDSKYFLEHGYKIKAIDGSEKMCELATKYIGEYVECMRFDELSDKELYDGIWACSSILHVEREELPNILKKMLNALKNEGIIYTCFKIGDKCTVQDGKYYNYVTKDIFETILEKVDSNAEIIDYYESCTSTNINRPKASWGNYLIKKKKKD